MQLPPSEPLKATIKHFLVLKNEDTLSHNYRLFSDGNPGMVFHFNKPLLQYKQTEGIWFPQPSSFAYGQVSDFSELISRGDFHMLVVVLQPYAIYSLCKVAGYELTNQTVPLTDIFGAKINDLEEQVIGAANICEAISLIESWLISQLKKAKEPDGYLKRSIELICYNKGMLTIEKLLAQVPVTERQMERKFKEYIGITPKKFTDIVRFQAFIKALKSSKSASITEMVYRFGYYDQAHLNNYFKRKTGVTPFDYKTNLNLLAVNLMQVD